MSDDDQQQRANWAAPVPPPPQPKWKWQTQGLAPGEQPRTNWGVSRRTGTVIVIVLILGAFTFALVAGLTDRPVERSQSEPTLRELIRARCPSHPECGIELDDRGAVLGFTLLPDATSDGGAALAIWARETGCIESVDISRMEQTRAIDGMVESANGRSTWTYHPDDGLTIVCEP